MSNKAVKRHFHLSVSDSRGNDKQVNFPDRMPISNEDELRQAICFDHVCAELEDNYRRAENFLSIDCFFADVDNDNTSSEETMKAWMIQTIT